MPIFYSKLFRRWLIYENLSRKIGNFCEGKWTFDWIWKRHGSVAAWCLSAVRFQQFINIVLFLLNNNFFCVTKTPKSFLQKLENFKKNSQSPQASFSYIKLKLNLMKESFNWEFKEWNQFLKMPHPLISNYILLRYSLISLLMNL